MKRLFPNASSSTTVHMTTLAIIIIVLFALIILYQKEIFTIKGKDMKFNNNKKQTFQQIIKLQRNSEHLSYKEDELTNSLLRLKCINACRNSTINEGPLLNALVWKHPSWKNQFNAFADSLNNVSEKSRSTRPLTIISYNCYNTDLLYKLANSNWINCPCLPNSSIVNNSDQAKNNTPANLCLGNLCQSYTTQNTFDLINPSLLLVNKE